MIASDAITTATVTIVPLQEIMSRAGWSRHADPDTNLDRLREVLFETQTLYYHGPAGLPVDPEVAIRAAMAEGCPRVTFSGAH
jgi:hypothetical protein